MRAEEPGESDPLADPAFLRASRRRDPAALETFFDAAFPFVHAIALRLTGDRTAAEDVTQDALFRIHQGLDHLDPDRPARPWLATITRNVFRDRWRRTKRERESRDATDPVEVVADARGAEVERPEDVAIRRERNSLLERAIAALTPDLREVLVLRVSGGLDYEQIAAVVGIRPDAARKRYSRALDDVRQRVRRWES